ncbi:hypothetical protein LAZ67_8000968 [Cordylochernes scorpioides]|uniref:Uncharacterized protein n=1 Tax=Cordylochernes scorpioides TaxID=51811 RepID=A0ABY6KPU5_9ARAC|nr:hypothetical protein LAZ67_8000968 [Cordylochernes scorpioides]
MSLDKALTKGPDLVRPLTSVLWNFRAHRYTLTRNISDMFHRVGVIQGDWCSRRSLWRGGESWRETEQYEIQVLIFGVTSSSPCSAIYAKNKNALEHKLVKPQVSQIIQQDFYVDDCLTRAGSIEACKELRKELSEINEAGPGRDLSGAVLTKRPAYSLVMSVYDPLGLVNHFKVKGIMLLQRTWISEIDWDQEFPQDIYDDWLTWLGKLKEIARASHEAYTSSAYLRCVPESEEISVALFGSKARVVLFWLGERKRKFSQLELQVAVLGSRFTVTIKCELKFRLDRFVFWSYSKVVLSWIHADGMRHKEFEVNRVGEIQEATGHCEWKSVPKDGNPADIATRFEREISFEPCGMRFTGTLSRLVRRTAAVQRAASYCNQKILKCRDKISTLRKCSPDDRKKIMKDSFIVNPGEYDAELKILVKWVQTECSKPKKLLKSQKTPAILPSRHHFPELLIQAEHERCAHQGTETVLNNLRKKFWIVDGRQTVLCVSRQCWEKRWEAIFTCLVTRGIHLEVVHELSTDEALMTLRCFIDTRGRPFAIYTPHFKEAWERLIKSVKECLYSILNENHPKDMTLLTALKSVENIVNSCPITYMSNNPTEEEALTPNHFLRGSNNAGPAIPSKINATNNNLRNQWKRAQILADRFWIKCTKD